VNWRGSASPACPPFEARRPPLLIEIGGAVKIPLLRRILPLFRLQRRSPICALNLQAFRPGRRGGDAPFAEIRCFCRCYQQIQPAVWALRLKFIPL
jgi:hypothetical protein